MVGTPVRTLANGVNVMGGGATALVAKPRPHVLQHPAPFPDTAPQQISGGAKSLPPQPILKLNHKDNSE